MLNGDNVKHQSLVLDDIFNFVVVNNFLIWDRLERQIYNIRLVNV
jgi:hypothetical protein